MDTTQNLVDFLIGNKNIKQLKSEELKCLPLEYFLKEVGCMDLLNIWSKLPYEYISNYELQIRLPCFVHYNRPEVRVHIDGPPSSQKKCQYCLQTLGYYV